MNSFTETNLITCDTTDEHSHAVPSTTIITPTPTPSGEFPHNIQGVSGQTYAPMNTDPFLVTNPPETKVDQLMAVLQVTLEEIICEMNAKHAQPDLAETVETIFKTSDWFDRAMIERVSDALDENDFDYEIGNNVERYMRNTFDPNDHVDFREIVADRVDDLIDDLVAEKVEERLAEILEEKLQNANITITF